MFSIAPPIPRNKPKQLKTSRLLISDAVPLELTSYRMKLLVAPQKPA